MKRIIKNIIMIFLLVLSMAGIYGVMYFAKNNLKEASAPSINFNNSQNMGNEMQEPPEKTEDEKGNVTTQQETPPEKPDDDKLDANTDNMQNDFKPNENMEFNQNTSNDISLTWKYYLAFSILSCISCLVIIYLIMSKFNKLTIKETFINFDKVLIFILLVIILTFGFVWLEKYLTENYFINSESKIDNKMSSNNSSASYSSVYEIVEDKEIENNSFESTNSDENAVLVSGNIDVELDNVTISKTGDSDSGDDTSFYGINSAVIAKDGANLIIKNSSITTNAKGANGIFSYGGNADTNNTSSDGTTVTVSDTKITTTEDNSGGIMTTGGGVMIANNLEVSTSGTSSAAIRTDRGGGDVTVSGGNYQTTGTGSPAVYSTANVTIKNANLTSKASEGIIVEGKNSVSLENVTLKDNNTKLNGQSTTYKNIFLYQSTSGDASDGTSEFTSTGSTITTTNGDVFYVTNTSAKITLKNNTYNFNSNGYFLRIQKDSWGNDGSNGGEVNMSLTNENITGNIYVDEISTLDISLNNSNYTGVINSENTAKSISLTIDKSSKITLNGNWYVTSFTNADSKNSNIDFNGYKIYVDGKAIN